MGIQLADQTKTFLYACLLGAALGLLYDVFRITRIAFPREKLAFGRTLIFFEDMIFFFVCAVVTFLYLMGAVKGHVRIFLLVGELIGAVLYYFTIGGLIMKISHVIINAIRALLSFLFRFIVSPIWRFFYWIVSTVCRPLRFLGKILKKTAIKAKFHLKVRRIVLYNQVTGFWKIKLRKQKTGEHGDYGTETGKKEETR